MKICNRGHIQTVPLWKENWENRNGDAVLNATAALDQALGDVASIRDDKNRRIEQLEAGLTDFGRHTSACNVHSLNATGAGTPKCNCGYGVLFVRNTGHVHDWSDVDVFGWRTCRDTDCGAGMPPFVEDSGQ